jgi:hypothetical protein
MFRPLRLLLQFLQLLVLRFHRHHLLQPLHLLVLHYLLQQTLLSRNPLVRDIAHYN